MDLDIFMNCETSGNVPSAYVGLKILLVDHDTTFLSNIATILEEHSFTVIAIEQATIALSILLQQIDQFDLVMVDVNMPEMDYLEFIKSTQLIKDKPIILMSPEVTKEMVNVALAQGACYIFKKTAISSTKLKNVWQHVYLYNKNSNRKSQHNKVNQVNGMDNTSRAKKLHDEKGKGIANCSETYQDQAAGSLIERNEAAKSSKRKRSTDEETQINSGGSSEKQDDHSLLLKTRTEKPQKKRQRVQWTPDLDKELDEVIRELGEKATPKNVLEKMCEPDLTKEQLTYRLKKYRSQKKQALNVQPTSLMNFNEEHQQAPNVQPATLMNFNEQHHSNVLDSNDLSMDYNELFQGACIPQPPEVPFIASSSSNEYSLNGWNGLDEFLKCDKFDTEIMSENQQAPNVQPPTLMNFNEEHHSNVLDSNDFSTNFNEQFQGACIPQPPEVPFIDSSSSNNYSLNGWNEWDEWINFENFDAEIMSENQSDKSYNWLIDYVPVCGSSTLDNVSTSKSQNS